MAPPSFRLGLEARALPLDQRRDRGDGLVVSPHIAVTGSVGDGDHDPSSAEEERHDLDVLVGLGRPVAMAAHDGQRKPKPA